MTLRKTLAWILLSLASLAGLLVVLRVVGEIERWLALESYETVLAIENLSGQPIHNLEIAHNGEVVYRQRRLDRHELIALSNLNPTKGPEAKTPDRDIRLALAQAAIAFQRDSGGPEERLAFNAGGHHLFPDKCLITIAIMPQSIEKRGCIWMSKPKRQTKPKS
jgi:hypothetical protein